MRAWTLAVATILTLGGGLASGAEIKVLTVGGLQKPITLIAADFAKETGNQVAFTFTNPALLQKTLSEGSYDAIVVADAPIADLEKAGKLKVGSHAKVVRGGIAVAVKEGSKFPDVSTPEALKAALLAAKTIVYTDPATPNGSGEKTKQILEQIGAWDAVVARGKVMSLGPAKDAVAKGEFEIGLFNASEGEAPGCVIAGIVPASIQRYTSYDAGVTGNAANGDAAASFVKFLTGKAAGERWKAGKMEPSPAS
jgi:molybdate transport system substrate-binding protein